jgi:TniQ
MYDALDLSQPSIPPRSILYQLPPIGIGTPTVESLTSYLARLAVSHTVTVGALLEYEVARLIDKKYGAANLQSISRLRGAVNSIGSMTRDLVCALEQLTMQQNLHLLTMFVELW